MTMLPDTLKRKNTAFWILNISGWLLLAGYNLLIYYKGKWTDIGLILLLILPYFTGFFLCIGLRYLFRAIHFTQCSLKTALPISLLVSFLMANIWFGLDIAFIFIFREMKSPPPKFLDLYISNIYPRLMTLLGWIFLYFGIKLWMEWKQQEQRSKKANDLAQAAQLQMLRYQINPHFLFNAMNSIRALIDEDEEKARDMITELSEFLRYSLTSKDYADAPLRDEIEAIHHYFAIQKKRYEDKLNVLFDIDPEAEDFPVLCFLIHPLIENAIKYGMQTSPMPLTVQLKAKVQEGSLRVEVCNTGKWIESDRERKPGDLGTGTGLDNILQRLENAFPNRYHFDVLEKEGSVHIKLEIKEPRVIG